jgi:polysaccharide pyruvyl transferase WcaK-like protein
VECELRKVVICAVPFSDNLGDGVIADGLGSLVRNRHPTAEVELLDIAGREYIRQSAIRGGRVYRLFQELPSAVRGGIATAVFSARYLSSWRKSWQKKLHGADLVIVGGGNLFADVSLNFPVKLYLLSFSLSDKRCVVFGVGASSQWTPIGKYLIRRFFARARPEIIVARDTQSAGILRELAAGINARILVAPDAALAIPNEAHEAENSWDVGLCISDICTLRYNVNEKGGADSVTYFAKLYALLVADGKRVLLFINGAAEDEKALVAVAERLRLEGEIPDIKIPRTPEALISTICMCRSIVAHRMHANIVAYRFAIPSVGIEWDPKVRFFLESVDRADCLVPAEASPSDVLNTHRILRSIDEGDVARHRRSLAAALDDVL